MERQTQEQLENRGEGRKRGNGQRRRCFDLFQEDGFRVKQLSFLTSMYERDLNAYFALLLEECFRPLQSAMTSNGVRVPGKGESSA